MVIIQEVGEDIKVYRYILLFALLFTGCSSLKSSTTKYTITLYFPGGKTQECYHCTDVFETSGGGLHFYSEQGVKVVYSGCYVAIKEQEAND